jgi:hypothetical protein
MSTKSNINLLATAIYCSVEDCLPTIDKNGCVDEKMINESAMTVVNEICNSDVLPPESIEILKDLLNEMKKQSLVVTSFNN